MTDITKCNIYLKTKVIANIVKLSIIKKELMHVRKFINVNNVYFIMYLFYSK